MIDSRYFYWRSIKVQSIHFKYCFGDTDLLHAKNFVNSTFLQPFQAKLSPTDLFFIIKYDGTLRPVIRWFYDYLIFQRQPTRTESENYTGCFFVYS